MNNTWPEQCVCYQESKQREHDRAYLILWAISAIAVVIIIIALMSGTKLNASPSCLTKSEARENWPRSHLYWHGQSHCWDNRHGGGRHFIKKLPHDAGTARAMLIPSYVDPLIKNELDMLADIQPFVIMFFPVDERLTFLTWEYRISGTLP